MNFDEIRKKIDNIDNEMTRLFEDRMALISEITDYKMKKNSPILGTARERDIINRVTEQQTDEMAQYTKIFFTTLFDISRSYQSRRMYINSNMAEEIKSALLNTSKIFPNSAAVACQGIEGANSQFACEKLFSRPTIMYMNSFDAVFTAVDKGLCNYGILPIENNLHGSVTEVYDLMKKYKFYIARSIKLKINHVLLANKGTKLEEINEIYSHEQAFAQCSKYLESLKGVKVIPCENTAVAAKKVFDSGKNNIAAISSMNCAELYNLGVLATDIQNSDNNYTRFICISKDMEIYPGANKISLIFTIPHRPGSLYRIISKFSALGINMTKLESRPIPGSDFEFMFYIDFEGYVHSEEILNLICEMENSPDFFAFLGNYYEA
ncbi:Chorismate mutase I [Candidatus Syntrophocurvum alkaliphilum]|uniref:Bifunctional chorismate mutase/prephenate dehydratase n=1 Tax=Candidatus Syntrophocurvum alkaliphilum TaxID=2293317 RepID=A0A6I6DDQ5_9FIRM|nr:bifunctional chorismate mutase/prephenate dehydratase [Candidatus Syntrophocurvum alkaliphilum]QGT99337.1 Chorismate mutase I [Candidatus Syntrophocurvum alkaliphilum]